MLLEMINYTRVADERMRAIFEQHQVVPAKALTLFSHILNAQHIWANRILGNTPIYGVWEEHLLVSLRGIADDNMRLFTAILETVDLQKEIAYGNSSGRSYVNVVQDILFHVVNHSTYHRGQIASLLKADNIVPPLTDFIILKREMQL